MTVTDRKNEENRNIINMIQEGATYRDISSKLGCSLGKISLVWKNYITNLKTQLSSDIKEL
jgi:uncharacterized protein YerC